MLDPSFGLTLWHVLAGLTALALYTCGWRIGLIGVLLLANWYICTFWVATPEPATGVPEWDYYALVDWSTGAAVAFLARNKIALTIALLFVASLCAHLAIGAIVWWTDYSPLSMDVRIAYWETTHWAAWLEAWALAIMGGRQAYDLGDRWLSRDRNRPAFHVGAEALDCTRSREGRFIHSRKEIGR